VVSMRPPKWIWHKNQFKVTVSQDFDTCFAHGFKFAEKFDLEITKIGFLGVNETAEAHFFCWSSPLTFTFSSNYKYVMFQHVFVFAIVSL
jgi:hypothetical protein